MINNSANTGVIDQLIQELTRLPGVGPKSAERMSHFLLNGDGRNAVKLAEALLRVAEQVHPCPICFNLTEWKICPICSDPKRDDSILCVVETPRDVNTFERAASFRGKYHVLNGRLAPLDGMHAEKLNFDSLLDRVKQGRIREVILATSPTLEGDGTALYASNLLQGLNIQITRLARGIPSGSSIELANPQMLADALEGRRVF